jgi:transcriptional regulator with XRE-family HTH domain
MMSLMKIERQLTDEAVLAELGGRLAQARLVRNLTQDALAAQSGVNRKVLQRIEAGEAVNLTSFVRVLRALGLLDALDGLVPEPGPRPIDLLKLHGKARRRATGRRRRRRPEAERDGAWQWGDEAQSSEA